MKATPTLLELASRSRRALMLGAGGAGDLVQALPLAHFLRLLGVEVVFGGAAVTSWGPKDGRQTYDVAGLQPAVALARDLVRVDSASRYQGHRPAEAILAEGLGGSALVYGLAGGVIGLQDSLTSAIAALEIDLVVAVDLAGEIWLDDGNFAKTHGSWVSRALVAALSGLEAPVVYAFGGYEVARDAPSSVSNPRVEALMRAEGCLGAIEPSQGEIEDMLAAYARLHEAAPSGADPSARRLAPLAASVLLFGPLSLLDDAGAGRLKATSSLPAIERLGRAGRGPALETRWRPVAGFRGQALRRPT